MKFDFGCSLRWIACATLLAVCAHGAETAAEDSLNSSATVQLKAGLDALGIGADWRIVVGDERDVVEQTAAEELQRLLARAGLEVPVVPESQAPESRRFLLGRLENLKALQEPSAAGVVRIKDVSTKDDGFHVIRVGDDIVVAGANPRGVLYGVYAFDDFLTAGTQGPLDIRKVPQITARVYGVPTFLMYNHPPAFREAHDKMVRYFARVGINGCIDGGGGGWDLSQFVSSDVFPFQKGPNPELQQRISSMSSLCRAYGVDYYIMLWEPVVATAAADAAAYPPEALGRVKRPWGGDENGMDTTLCVSSPVVQEHYRDLMRKFVRQYPDVKGFLFYNLDGNSWLCTPALCPRCKAVCTDSPADTPHPWETQARFTDLLAQTAREERSDFQFIHWISHFTGEAAEKLVRQSDQYTALAFGVQNGDHDVMIADPLRREDSEFAMLQRVCLERGVPFYVTFSSNTHEVLPNGFAMPFNIGQSITRLREWDVRAITSSGAIPYFNSISALVEREYHWNPNPDPEAFLSDLAVRQFGEEAGDRMYQAWEQIRDGMDLWRDMKEHPFRGSHTPYSLGFSYFTNAPAVLPEIVEHDETSYRLLGGTAVTEADRHTRLLENQDRFRRMGIHMAKAAALAREAVELADDDKPIGIDYYDDGNVPTRKQYAELNYGPLAIADTFCRLRHNMFSAILLLKAIDAETQAGNEAEARELKRQYHDVIRKDIAIRERFIETLNQFAEMRPCLTRTSLSEDGIASEIAYMNTEIEKMKAYLAEAEDE